MIYFKNKKITLLLIFNFLVINQNIICIEAKKPWTVLTYVASRNSLANFAPLDVEEMRQGANNNVHALCYLNSTKNQTNISQRLTFKNGKIIHDGPDITNLDSGKASTVINALDWALANYPSDKFCLILWDHGNAWRKNLYRGVCWDDVTGSHLSDKDLEYITSYASKKLGKKIDILAFDACLMAETAIAYAVKPYVSNMVASQQTIPGKGFDYKGLLNGLAKQDLNPSTFAIWMVKAYDLAYKITEESYTLSAIDLTNFDKLSTNIDSVAKLLTSQFQNNNTNSINIISQAIKKNNSIRFEEESSADLFTFYLYIYQKIPQMKLTKNDTNNLKSLLSNGMYLINQLIKYKTSSPEYKQAKGISIYLPIYEFEVDYDALIWSKISWAKFIKAYLNS